MPSSTISATFTELVDRSFCMISSSLIGYGVEYSWDAWGRLQGWCMMIFDKSALRELKALLTLDYVGFQSSTFCNASENLLFSGSRIGTHYKTQVLLC